MSSGDSNEGRPAEPDTRALAEGGELERKETRLRTQEQVQAAQDMSFRIRKSLFTMALALTALSVVYSSIIITRYHPELILNINVILAILGIAAVSFGLLAFEREKINLDTRTGVLQTALQPLRGLRARYGKTWTTASISSGVCLLAAILVLWLGAGQVRQYNLYCSPRDSMVQWTDWIGYDNAKCSARRRVSVWRLGRFEAWLIDPDNNKKIGSCKVGDDALSCEAGPTVSTDRILLVRTGEQDFARTIEFGFKTELERKEKNYSVDVMEIPSYASSKDLLDQLGIELDKRQKASDYRYYVSVGSQAAIWLQAHLDRQGRSVPHMFLGVTDPVDAGLMPRGAGDGSRAIWGIQYGDGAAKMVELVRIVFQNEKLIFAYDPVLSQDASFARQMPKEVVPLVVNRDFAVDELRELSAVYLSWYTLEERFTATDRESARLLKERTIVTSTEANVRNRLAAVGVGANDADIGRQGAAFISEMIHSANRGLGRRPFEISPFRLYLNCNRARASGITISKEALISAHSLYECHEDLNLLSKAIQPPAGARTFGPSLPATNGP